VRTLIGAVAALSAALAGAGMPGWLLAADSGLALLLIAIVLLADRPAQRLATVLAALRGSRTPPVLPRRAATSRAATLRAGRSPAVPGSRRAPRVRPPGPDRTA
jgi:hypothetical protein